MNIVMPRSSSDIAGDIARAGSRGKKEDRQKGRNGGDSLEEYTRLECNRGSARAAIAIVERLAGSPRRSLKYHD